MLNIVDTWLSKVSVVKSVFNPNKVGISESSTPPSYFNKNHSIINITLHNF